MSLSPVPGGLEEAYRRALARGLALQLARQVAAHFQDTDAPLGKLARDYLAYVKAGGDDVP